MNRRSAIASTFALAAGSAVAASPDRGDADIENGKVMARVFKYNEATKKWLEIGRGDVRKGDLVCRVGISDGELWLSDAIIASQDAEKLEDSQWACWVKKSRSHLYDALAMQKEDKFLGK